MLVACAAAFSALRASGSPAGAVSGASATSEVSWSSTMDAWQARATGVFATENGGRSWHEIYTDPAMEILRLSADAGVIELGTSPGACMCTTRKLWTDDDGATWHTTDAIGTNFAGSAGSLYWWEGGDLRVISPFPPADSTKPLDAKLASALPDGTIVAAASSSGGEAFLVSNRVAGQHWDTDPRVLLATAAGVQTIRLPSAPPGEILAESIDADGDTLTVTGTDYGADPATTVTWTSTDGGQTWSLD